jgi:hypothetical protein
LGGFNEHATFKNVLDILNIISRFRYFEKRKYLMHMSDAEINSNKYDVQIIDIGVDYMYHFRGGKIQVYSCVSVIDMIDNKRYNK